MAKLSAADRSERRPKPQPKRIQTNLQRFIDDELEEAEYARYYRTNLPGRDRINRQ